MAAALFAGEKFLLCKGSVASTGQGRRGKAPLRQAGSGIGQVSNYLYVFSF